MSSRNTLTIDVEPIEDETPGEPVVSKVVPVAKNKPRLVLVAAAVGLSIILVAGYFLSRDAKLAATTATGTPAATAPATPLTISTATAVERELPVTISASGTFTPYEFTDVASQIPGLVVSTRVEAGDFVRRGQVLAVLDDRDARLRVQQAEAALSQAESALKQTRATLGLDGSGALDPARVAEVESAKANLELARANERRYRMLLDSGDVPQAQYDEFKARLDTAQKTYEAAMSRAKSGGAGIDAAASAVEAARVQLAMARKRLADTVIKAPLDGHVGERQTAAGEWVTEQSKIVSIVQSNKLKLVLLVSEEDSSRIKLGMPATLTVDAYGDEEFRGIVGAILPSLDGQSRSLAVVVGVLNGDGRLRPGMFATGRIVDSVKGRVVPMVPESAVLKTITGSSQIFVISDNRAHARIVQTGPAIDGFVPVYAGLQQGEEVAVSGVESLSDAAEIVTTGR